MKPLVVVRWRGEIVGTQDSFALDLTEGDGVTTEVVDVSAERAATWRWFRPVVDAMPIAMFVASIMMHVVAGVALVIGATLLSNAKVASVLDPLLGPQNDKGSDNANPTIKVASDEQQDPVPATEPQPLPPQPAQPPIPTEVTPEEPPETSTTNAQSVPAEAVPESKKAADAIEGQSGTDDISASPSTCTPVKAVANNGPTCTRTVLFQKIEKSPGCYVDTAGKQGDKGTLTFPCNGDGRATLRFGKKAFVGAINGGKVDVCTGTEYTYPPYDSCKWTSAQRVSGSLGSGTLHFSYGEAPKAGQENCAASCGALATIKVLR